MRTSFARIVVLCAVLFVACGDSGAPDDAASATDASGRSGASSDTRNREGRSSGTDADAGDDGGVASEEDVPSDEICDAVTAEDVAEILDVRSVDAMVSETGTPQCTYRFRSGENAAADVTIAVLRREEDLGGRTGAAAFDHVVELNASAGGDGDVKRMELDAGDESVLLSGNALHMGVVRYGRRIVTMLVPAGAADLATATALVEATRTLDS